jgi:hypothetical protein
VTVAFLCFVSACSESAATTNALANAAATVLKSLSPPTTTTITTTSAVSVVYDTSMGASVDADGFAALPLRSGAHRYFVSSASGSDGNGCSNSQQPGTPLKTITAAMNCVANNEGDQVLLAEGTSYSDQIGWLAFKQGYSAAYPMVISSYDPTDPTNEAKYGRGDQRNARPIVTALQGELGNGTYSFLAIKGLEFNPGNVSDGSLIFVGKASYVLIENNVLRYTGLTFDTADYPVFPTTQKLIIRNNSIYGMWSTGGRTGGLYVAGYVGPTVEDNVFYHCGWNVTASRSFTGNTEYDSTGAATPAYLAYIAAGGATVFSHSYYIQTNTTGAIVRRNLSADAAGDGGTVRGDSTLTENMFIDNPAAIGLGGGPEYNIDRPSGVTFDASYNAVMGDADVNSGHLLGWGINTTNGTSGSRVHNNLIVRSRNPSAPETGGFSNNTSFNQPSYAQYDHNLIWNWVSQTNQTHSYYAAGGAYPAQSLATYDYNNWDGLLQGTNTNSTNTVFPNPYTAAQLYAALGYADKASFINYVINHPEAHIQRNARSLLFTGYGM